MGCDKLNLHPPSGIVYFYRVGHNHFKNRLPQWCVEQLDSLDSHYVEVSLTGQKRILMTREPEQIKAILATQFTKFGHGPQWHRLWRPFLGDGIFATDGQQWHDSRNMIRPMFVKERVRDLDMFDAAINKLMSKLPPAGTTVDVKDLFYRLTLDTTTEFLLGQNVNSLDKYVTSLRKHGAARVHTNEPQSPRRVRQRHQDSAERSDAHFCAQVGLLPFFIYRGVTN